jgi:hypothetical protein
MKFIDRYTADDLARKWAEHEVLGPATRTLTSLIEWTDGHSDGWAYWPKPARAAEKLMDLIDGRMTDGERCPDCYQGQGGYHSYWCRLRPDATPAALKAALRPVKAFRTRMIKTGMPPFGIADRPPEPRLPGESVAEYTRRTFPYRPGELEREENFVKSRMPEPQIEAVADQGGDQLAGFDEVLDEAAERADARVAELEAALLIAKATAGALRRSAQLQREGKL